MMLRLGGLSRDWEQNIIQRCFGLSSTSSVATIMAEVSSSAALVIPGDKIGTLSQFESGNGTYIRGDDIIASLVGSIKSSDSTSTSAASSKPVLSVIAANAKPTIVPKEKSIVLAQVTKITPRFAQVAIVSVDDVTLLEYFPGTIRVSDIQTSQAEPVEVYKCFRPGDLVRAEVISLGDSRSYYLTTAKNEYGVIMARSMAGHTMEPISWNLMQCPKTKQKEYRKVAKT